MATQQYWMMGDPTTTVQVIVTVNTATWRTSQIEVKNGDPMHHYVFKATSPQGQVTTWTAGPGADIVQAVTIQMLAAAPNDDGTMGNPSWPAGWSVSGVWT